jgi:RHS repeat-associated protein
MVYTAYGTERTSTADGREKFGTYFRDGTGLDYADQRYYGDSGRFLSVDPGNAGDPTNPTSLNRYAYVLDDPINNQDPEGLCTVMIGGITQTPYTPDVTAQQDVATQLGAISAYPYAGGSIPSGVANVLAQGAGLPTGAALVALDAIALAAQNPGQIDIIAFSGGAQAFTTAWGYLSADVQSRIGSITYVDPGAAGQLTAGNPGTWGSPGTDVKVIEDSVGFANTALQLLGSGTPTSPNPPGAEYVDAGGCGHDANCVFAKFLDWFQGSSCQTGAGGVFGAPVSHTIQLVGNSSWWAPGMGGPPVMVYWWELPPVPSVSSTIKYNLQ